MIESTDRFFYRLRFLVGGALIIICLLTLPFLPRLIWIDPTVHAANTTSSANYKNSVMEDSPNAITRGLFRSADTLNRFTGSTEKAVNNGLHAVTDSISTATTSSGKFVAHGVGGSVSFVAGAAVSGTSFIAHTTGSALGIVTNVSKVGNIIKPADANKAPLPAIDGDSADLVAADAKSIALSDAKPAATPIQADSKASWPIHGIVTLEFGASDWPYQTVHTGIDISDGKIGTTAIHPFKPGVVIAVIHSYAGLGNHVIIDHGGGITSVYGHMYSTAVTVGQKVDKNTKLGYEGSTGASTGPHVHFEIRVNGQPVNPRKFVSGQP